MKGRHTRRGFWIVGLCCTLLAGLGCLVGSPAAAADDDGFQSLFDGKTLEGWDGDPKLWRVEDGAITGQTSDDDPIKHNSFLIWREGKVDDFELTLEYRIEGGNSGIQYRSWEEPEKVGRWVIGGYQADIDSKGTWTGALYGERYRGILAARGQKTVIGDNHKPKVVGEIGSRDELLKHIKPDGWNKYRIVGKGYTFIHEINGHTMVEVTDEDTAERRRSGLLAFQVHRGPPMKVQFRNIRLKRLPMEDKKKIAFIAGLPSHGYGGHEHYAGCVLLAKCLNENVPQVHAVVYRNGWPQDPTALDNADAIVVFSNGGGRQPLMGHLDEIDRLMKKGVGLGLIHYAVEVPKGEPGNHFLDWVGGYYETWWSVNPHWRAEFAEFPDHPVARGLKPFWVDDEWYYHMRFREDMKGVTPILTTVPPDSTRERPDGAHSNNPANRARKGMPEHVCWVCEREDGGRGFGFTGGHWHWNWANDSFRKVVLNAIVWIAGVEVPEGGVESRRPTIEELKQNQDYPEKKDFDWSRIERLIDQWHKPLAEAEK